MAQKVTVVLEDDLTGGPAEQTVRFAFDGTDYEIDLSAKNAAAFGKQLATYIEHARRAGRAPSRRPGRTAAGRQRSGDIRAWAKEHGLAVSERGRIPASVVEQPHRRPTRDKTCPLGGIADVYQPDGPLPFGGWTIPNAPVSDSSSNACATAPWKRWLPSAKATRAFVASA